jgi:hypothetical protein
VHHKWEQRYEREPFQSGRENQRVFVVVAGFQVRMMMVMVVMVMGTQAGGGERGTAGGAGIVRRGENRASNRGSAPRQRPSQ